MRTASIIQQVEAALVARLTEAFTTPGKPHPIVDVLAWPSDPRTFKMQHPVGACMVIYRGLTDDNHSAMAGQRVEQEASYEIGILARTLREHQPPQGAQLGTGAYDLLDTCRKALMGWRVPVSSGVTKVKKDAFDDYIEGVWGYTIQLTVPLMTVLDIAESDEPWMAGDGTLNSIGHVGDGERLGDSTLPVPDPESPFTPFIPPAIIPPDYP